MTRLQNSSSTKNLSFALALACLLAIPLSLPAAEARVAPPPGIKTFSRMPKSATEVASAHLNARNEGIEFLGKGEPLQLSSYLKALNPREARERERDRNKSPLTIISTRSFVLSVGIEVDAADQRNLPALSKTTILDYLGKHYVSLQARIHKDSKGHIYLHHRPLVATAKFGGSKITEDFAEGVVASVRDMHSLGLFVPDGVDPIPENLRTVVLVHKHTALEKGRPETRYEFVFIRGRVNSLAGRLDTHCFTTSEERTKLHYLKPAKVPLRYNDCSLKGQVVFTRFTGGDLIPAESAVRSQSISDQSEFEISELDKAVRSQLKLSGDTLSNLNETLDAIIDGRIKASKTKLSSVGTTR